MYIYQHLSTESKQKKVSLDLKAIELLTKNQFIPRQVSQIVQDFEVLVDYVLRNKVEVSASQNAIAPKYLKEINSLLSKPISIDLQRPSQKSYPYIHGLYLLLRGSEMGKIQAEKKPILQIDQSVLNSWQTLNDTEKYFNLLATWMFYADENIMGDHRGGVNEWWYVFNSWNDLPKEGLKIKEPYQNESWISRNKLHNVALLGLFGFVILKDKQPLAGKGWCLESVKALPFGNAMMNILGATDWIKAMLQALDGDDDRDFEQETSMGVDVVSQDLTPTEILQEEIQALELFPEWQNNLQTFVVEAQDGTFIFKVSLKIQVMKGDRISTETVWRKIAIPSNLTLYDFSSAILDAFNFANDHLHQFVYKDRKGFQKTVCHPYAQESPFTDTVLLKNWQITKGDRLTYVFDFGDWWEFDVVLESIEEPNPKLKKAKVVETKGKAPKQYGDYD
ncbi:plasmid pRiA4b ORF-3 family protein [Pseudanabaena sp. FACHB-1998]|uniref:plasmid pRiA4b ORF-3 family protein n=1 Tax=Pseudanabaena sp. FACHB-1998 TaxID=2692858 RepID=UPI001680EA8F|nr:plasmid pRiA4b ORF-3 family protein [Pseudanabaena sp. FACHB-1998]MBD2176768.1 plasmid pRiA4b ORF-3 family protein [Pseudanabaena sp. FACHB-1998]